MRTNPCWTLAIAALVGLWIATAGTEARSQAEAARQPNQDAAKLQNPVKPDATSIAAGKKLYDQLCVECHGQMGKGDGPRAPYTTPTTPDLADADWKHGSTDGSIFVVIRDGIDGTDMPAFGPKGEKVADRQLWDVVNYVRSLVKTAKAH